MNPTVPAPSFRKISRLAGGQTYRQVFDGLAATARGIGFESCVYLLGLNERGSDMHLSMLSTASRSWQERYRRQAYGAIDPTVRHARSSGAPLVWSPEYLAREAPGTLARAFGQAGLNHGWTQSLRDGSGAFGALTLARDSGALTRDELAWKQPMMLWLAQVAHVLLLPALLARQQRTVVTLTERETELLRLAAAGRTAAEMSASLGLTERTANFHIGNAIEKLGAANKVQAVALAIRLGLID